jgi:hypothetical protein
MNNIIQWLFLKTKINKLKLEEGDVLVLRPPTKGWNIKQAEQYHKFIVQTLKDCGYKNLTITFADDVDLGIINTSQKSNYENQG